MSVDVLVVEAAEYSGRRITARWNKIATWEDVWEDRATEVRLALTPTASAESSAYASASLFPDEGLLLTRSESWSC
jgi:hypothetical protein